MKIDETSMAIMSFAESYVFPSVTDNASRFLCYTALFLALPQVEAMIQQNIGLLVQMGVVSEDGVVNTEKLKDAGLKAFEKVASVKIWKFTFDKTDFEKFIEHINK